MADAFGSYSNVCVLPSPDRILLMDTFFQLVIYHGEVRHGLGLDFQKIKTFLVPKISLKNVAHI